MSAQDPKHRILVAQIAANERWARTTDRSAATAKAREALDQKFLDEADGDPVRAANLRKAHFQRLALKSAQARNARKTGAATDGGGAA